MALGTVKASGGLQTQLVQDNSSSIVAQAAQGLGDTVNRLAQAGLGYLNSQTDIQRVYDARIQGSIALDLDTRFAQYQADRAKEFTEFSRERSASPLGMTREYDERLAAQEAEFLKTVPPRFQDEVKNKLAEDRASRVGSAFVSELTLLDTADTNTLNTNLNTLGSGLKGGSVTLEDAEAQWEASVNKSGLDAATKQQFIESGKATLQGLEFGTLVEQGALGFGAVADGSNGSDVVAAGLLPQERAVLNVIAKNEAPGYNVWNGGTTFEGYEDHPAATGAAPGESTAAGRYQFIRKTWRLATASYERATGVKVPDFSPEWQDRVALHWAEVQFNKHYSGATFREILASGDPQQLLIIRDVLGKPRSSNPTDLEWKGLGQMGDAEFIEMMTGQSGFAGGGTSSVIPNVWTDPRFSGLSLDAKQSFANAASAAAEQQKAAMAASVKLERETFLDQVYNAGYSGDPAIVSALQSSSQWDAEAQAKFNAGREVFRASERGSMNVGAALNSGTPLSVTQAKDFGRWFGEDGFAGIMTGDKAAYEKLGPAVNTARIFPEGSVDAFRAAMGNPDTQPMALEFLAMAHANDSMILKRSGFSEDDIGAVQLYANVAARSGSQVTAMEDWRKATDASALLGKTPTAIAKEADDLFTELYPTSDDLVSNFVGWVPWFFGETDITSLNPAVEGLLSQDARAAFKDGYSITGTEEGAEAYMQSYIDNTWGLTQTRSLYFGKLSNDASGVTVLKPVLMKHPPEKYFRDYNGGSGFVYNELAKFAVAGGAQPNNAVLVSDATTDKEVREGKRPTYQVIGVGEYGEAIVLPGRFGGEELGAIGDAGLDYQSSREHSLTGVAKFSAHAEDLRKQVLTAEKLGKDPAEIATLQEQLRKAETGLQAAKLAAVENEHLSADMPQSVDDPRLDDLAEIVSESFANDATVARKAAALAVSYKGLTREDANRKALATLLAQEYKLLPEVGVALAEKVLEKY